jgi:hypothetical protein
MTDDFFDIGWEAMALLGSLAEELAEEKVERLRQKQEMEPDDCDYCCENPPDEEPCP